MLLLRKRVLPRSPHKNRAGPPRAQTEKFPSTGGAQDYEPRLHQLFWRSQTQLWFQQPVPSIEGRSSAKDHSAQDDHACEQAQTPKPAAGGPFSESAESPGSGLGMTCEVDFHAFRQEAFATSLTTARKNRATVFCFHAGTESKLLFPCAL